MTETVKANHVASSFDGDRNAGDFSYYANREDELEVIAGIIFVCPCGCGAHNLLSFDENREKHWTYDGDKLEPTLSPDITTHNPCGWRGWLKEGQWIRMNNDEIKKGLKDFSEQMNNFQMMDGDDISMEDALKIFRVQKKLFGATTTLDKMVEMGGFSYAELPKLKQMYFRRFQRYPDLPELGG